MRNIGNIRLSKKQFKIVETLNAVMTVQVCIDKNKEDFRKQWKLILNRWNN